MSKTDYDLLFVVFFYLGLILFSLTLFYVFSRLSYIGKNTKLKIKTLYNREIITYIIYKKYYFLFMWLPLYTGINGKIYRFINQDEAEKKLLELNSFIKRLNEYN